MICAKPYPRVLLQIGSIGEGQAAVLKRLLDNKEQSKDGYRQRLFEVKQEKLSSKWHIFVTYDLPAPKRSAPDKNIVVGVDLGFRVPLYVALNNGEARLGWRNFAALGEQIKALQNQLDARRRSIQRAGRSDLSSDTAGAGHGRARKLQPTEKLEGKIHKAYTTLNHQLSRSVVEFAVDHGSGVIQMENLEGLQDQLRGKFIGARWRYHQLQQFIEYKAKEAGIDARKVNPRYTSRRCSKCGFINKEFSADFRHSHATPGFRAKFVCPNPDCKFEADPDYNAARNIATIDIEKQIVQQCKRQGISLGDEIIDNPNRAAQQAPLA
jgi:IS605 OrfB family transposase